MNIENYGNYGTIRFIGNHTENIDSILNVLHCNCNAKELFKKILVLFYEKIQKLRKEREIYKQSMFQSEAKQKNIHEQNNILKKQIQKLINQNNGDFCYPTQKLLKSPKKTKEKHNVKEYPQSCFVTSKEKLLPKEGLTDFHFSFVKYQQSRVDNLLESSPRFTEDNENENLKSSLELDSNKVKKLMKKFNLGKDEFISLLKSYFEQEKNIASQLQTDSQIKLFKEATNMEKEHWKKKVSKQLSRYNSVDRRSSSLNLKTSLSPSKTFKQKVHHKLMR